MKKILTLVCVVSLALSSCNKDDVIVVERPQKPGVEFDADPAVYVSKVGREITISPTYTYVDHAIYSWKFEQTGKIISTSPELTYTFDKVNESDPDGYYILLEVTNRNGMISERIRVEVVELAPPVISFAVPTDGLEVVKGRKYEFTPDVQNSENATYEWTLRPEGAAQARVVGTERTYAFCEQALGMYEVKLSTGNEDGTDEKTIRVEVVNALAVSATTAPIGWKYDGLKRTVALGRTLILRPYVWNGNHPAYSWTLDGQQVGTELSYAYTPTEKGVRTIRFTVTDRTQEPAAKITRNIIRTNELESTLEFTVEGCDEEGTHMHRATSASSVNWSKVYEYTPAPGQFINELATGGFLGTETTLEAAVSYAENRLKKSVWVSLGGWGGYVVAGFDHSIENSAGGYKEGYNFSIHGNQFEGSSEPGIVWVMQDTNGNTLPDDEWYELKGSESGKETETIPHYAVTYYRPSYSGANVQWKDNNGFTGCIDYLSAYHTQPSYYPNWIEANSYVLYGTCLKSRTYDKSGTGTYWVNGSYDWGYADNFGNDRLSSEQNAGAGACKTYFKISNAVMCDGTPAGLKYIDFIKVQSGVNVKAGWLGENSTEVFGFTDENINQGKR